MSLFGIAWRARWIAAVAGAAALGGCAATQPQETEKLSAANAMPAVAAPSRHDSEAARDDSDGRKSAHKTHAIVFDGAAKPSAPLPVRAAAATARVPGAAYYRVASAPAAEKAAQSFDAYTVVVAADEKIRKPGKPGEMRVWIGDPQFKPVTAAGMRSGETAIPALGDTAKVTPFAPGIEVEPKESVCERIDPSGSEVRFQLNPVEKGVFKVGADVALYASPDCSGAPIPKTAATVQVEVAVDVPVVIETGLGQLLNELWEGFLKFWGEVVALFFALLLFLLRKRLAERFGFKPAEGK